MEWDFDKLVEFLDSEPTEQCVIRELFLEEHGVDAELLGAAAGRAVQSAVEPHNSGIPNMGLRDRIFVFAPKESV